MKYEYLLCENRDGSFWPEIIKVVKTFDEIKNEDVVAPFEVVIVNSKTREKTHLKSVDDLEAFREGLSRACSWKGKTFNKEMYYSLVKINEDFHEFPLGVVHHISQINDKDVTDPYAVVWHKTPSSKVYITSVKQLNELRATLSPKVAIPSTPLADSNLKTVAAQGKPTISSIPPIAVFALGKAMQDGEFKYGRYNWRDTGSTSSVFFDAMGRHLFAWYSGEDHAKDSKIHHLAHLMAGCAILLDAEFHGALNDDRPENSNVENMLDLFSAIIKKD